MSQPLLNTVIKDGMITAAKVSGPILITMLVVGLIISLIQATTQIQEQTLTFLPKIFAAACVGIFLGSWMLEAITSYTTRIFEIITKITT